MLLSSPFRLLGESAARKLWPGRDAVGRSVVVAPDTAKPANRPPSTALVVGVARDTVVNDTDADEGRTTVYYPTDLQAAGSVLLVRVQDAPEAARQRLVTLLEAGDPGAVERTDTMQAFVDARDYPYRVMFWVSAALGGIALLFTLSGVYGVVTWTVAQRTREIGIRVAMGASIRAVVSTCCLLPVCAGRRLGNCDRYPTGAGCRQGCFRRSVRPESFRWSCMFRRHTWGSCRLCRCGPVSRASRGTH